MLQVAGASQFSKIDKSQNLRPGRALTGVLTFTNRALWEAAIGGSPSWCADFKAVEGQSFQGAREVKVPDSTGHYRFKIFQSNGSDGSSTNKFTKYDKNVEAELRVINEPLNTVDIYFKEPVVAWGAYFRDAKGAGETQLKLDFGNGFGSPEEIPYDDTFFGVFSPLKEIKAIRFAAVDRYAVERLFFSNVCASVRKKLQSSIRRFYLVVP